MTLRASRLGLRPLPRLPMQDYEFNPAENEADASATNPNSRRRHVSTSDPRNPGTLDHPWRWIVYGEPPERDPRTGRCNRCTTCKNVAKLGCTSKRDPNPCLGCLGHSPCWGTRPCELWSLLEEGRPQLVRIGNQLLGLETPLQWEMTFQPDMLEV